MDMNITAVIALAAVGALFALIALDANRMPHAVTDETGRPHGKLASLIAAGASFAFFVAAAKVAFL